jgi:hypothetical protein
MRVARRRRAGGRMALLAAGVLLALVHAARLDPGLLAAAVPFPAGPVLRCAVCDRARGRRGAPILARLPGLSAFAARERRAFA